MKLNEKKKIKIIVKIGSKRVICPSNGGSQTLNGFKGSIECPKYNDICSFNDNIMCNEMFNCLKVLSKNDFDELSYYDYEGMKFMITPRLGYAYGHYDRDGYEGRSYEGKVDKRIAGITSEARYPINIKGWTLSPTAEFNAIGYQIKAHEEDKAYALNIEKQNVLSVEAGIGIHLSKEYKFGEKHGLKLGLGAMGYHEFGDPYELKLSMQGMEGSYKLRDEKRRDNRIALRNSFAYDLEPFSIYGNLISYIDSEYRTKALLGFKYAF